MSRNRLLIKALLFKADAHFDKPTYTNPFDIQECLDMLEQDMTEDEYDKLSDWMMDCLEM